MKVNPDKCQIIFPTNVAIQIDNKVVGNVEEKTFLGSDIPESSSDVRRRIGLASAIFERLKDTIGSRKVVPLNIFVSIY